MKTPTFEQIRQMVDAMEGDFRVLTNPTLAHPNNLTTKGTLKGKFLCIVLSDWKNDGSDLLVAKQGLTASIIQNMKANMQNNTAHPLNLKI